MARNNYNVLFADITSLAGDGDSVIVTKNHELYEFIHAAVEGYYNGILTFGLIRMSDMSADIAFLYHIDGNTTGGVLTFQYANSNIVVYYAFD